MNGRLTKVVMLFKGHDTKKKFFFQTSHRHSHTPKKSQRQLRLQLQSIQHLPFFLTTTNQTFRVCYLNSPPAWCSCLSAYPPISLSPIGPAPEACLLAACVSPTDSVHSSVRLHHNRAPVKTRTLTFAEEEPHTQCDGMVKTIIITTTRQLI